MRRHLMPSPYRVLLYLLVAVAAMAAPAAAHADGSYVPGEVMVRYARGADQAAVERAAGVGGPRIVAPRTRVVRIRDGQSVADTVRELRARPDVATAAPERAGAPRRLHPAAIPGAAACRAAGSSCSGTSSPAPASTRPTPGST